MVDRRSPTPPHNTAQFESWIGFAAAMKGELADYPESPEVTAVLCALDGHERRFTEWKDERLRPAPADRTEHVVAFLETRNVAIELLQSLARSHPDIAAAALARHRAAFEKMKKENRR